MAKLYISACYLIAVIFFLWGYLAGSWRLYPGDILKSFDNVIYACRTSGKNFFEAAKDSLMLDPREFRTHYNISGLNKIDTKYQDNGFLLLARYSKQYNQSIVELFSIAQNKVLHTWIPPKKILLMHRNQVRETKYEPDILHPLLLNDGGLIFNLNYGPLFRIDKASNIVWFINKMFHHSVEMDKDGNIVTCITLKGHGEAILPISDDGIAIVSLEGKIIKEISIVSLLLKNGYEYLIYGIGPFAWDRIHLNDAQPILTNSNNSKVGDIAISIRSLSTVALIDSSHVKFKWVKTGPWIKQHDIDQLRDGRYSIFSNDVALYETKGGERFQLINGNSSSIYIYDPIHDTTEKIFNKIMMLHKINTPTEGRLRILPNGDAVVEQTDLGRIIRFSKNNVRWEYVNKISDDTVGVLYWSRYLTNDEFSKIKLTN